MDEISFDALFLELVLSEASLEVVYVDLSHTFEVFLIESVDLSKGGSVGTIFAADSNNGASGLRSLLCDD